MIDLFKDNCQILEEESFDDYLKRFKGFGKELYTEIKLETPVVFENLKLYKPIKSTEKCAGIFLQNLDSYGHYFTDKIFFRIYIDPESEVIGIHNYDFKFETGHWSNKPVKEIIDFIKKEVIPKIELV